MEQNIIPLMRQIDLVADGNDPEVIMIEITITMPRDENAVSIRTFDEPYGREGQFLLDRQTLSELLDDPVGSFRYAEDRGNFVEITRLARSLRFSFAWLNCHSDGRVRFVRQNFTVPRSELRYALRQGTTLNHLYIPKLPRESAAPKRTLSQAILDFFR